MANQDHLDILLRGVPEWNRWVAKHPEVRPDLSGADLSDSNLREVNLSNANLNNADLTEADLQRANLSKAELRFARLPNSKLCWADLRQAVLSGAGLGGATLFGADLSGAFLINSWLSATNLRHVNFSGAWIEGANITYAEAGSANFTSALLPDTNLSYSNLSGADLSNAILKRAVLVETNLSNAILTDCVVYGASAWKVNLEGAVQHNLIITGDREPTVTVDDLEVAQFIYLILNNTKIRNVIDTITSKAVLILGRFTPERKTMLNGIRAELRRRGYLPIVFDFDQPLSRNLTETVSTLAHISCFIIADITDARSVPQELQRVVPDLPSVPVQPLILASETEYAMFKDFPDYPWVLPIHRYKNLEDLVASLDEKILLPAVLKAYEISERRKVFEEGIGT